MDDVHTDGPQLVEVDATPTAVIDGVVGFADLPAFFDRAFGQVAATAATQGAAPTGAAFALYHRPPADTLDLEVGFPVGGEVRADGDVRPGSLPAGRVARLVHAGSYDDLGTSWARLQAWMADQGLVPGPVLWEVYVTEPSPDMDPADLRTELNWTIAG